MLGRAALGKAEMLLSEILVKLRSICKDFSWSILGRISLNKGMTEYSGTWEFFKETSKDSRDLAAQVVSR